MIAGDQNSDPLDGDSIPGAIQQLLDSPKVNTKVTPSSPGAVEQSRCRAAPTTTHLSDPAFDTADFTDSRAGQPAGRLRAAAQELQITDAGGLLAAERPIRCSRSSATFPFPSSDHRLVWVDVDV